MPTSANLPRRRPAKLDSDTQSRKANLSPRKQGNVSLACSECRMRRIKVKMKTVLSGTELKPPSVLVLCRVRTALPENANAYTIQEAIVDANIIEPNCRCYIAHSQIQ